VRPRIIVAAVVPREGGTTVTPLFMARLAAQTSSGLFPRALRMLIPVMATRSRSSPGRAVPFDLRPAQGVVVSAGVGASGEGAAGIAVDVAKG